MRVWQGDITTLDVDAIVNAANQGLRCGGGVCGAIFAAAGPRLDDACAALGGCATGDAVATPGFDLPARWIIHTVGPVWGGGRHGEDDHLASCYGRVVDVGVELGVESVAIPAISTGIFGFPADRAAEIAVGSLTARRDQIDDVVLVAFDIGTAQRYEALLAR